MRQCVQAIRSRVIVEEAATIAPATASVFNRFWRFPFPRPLELNRRAASGRIVPHKLHVRVVLQVGVCMKLSGDQVVKFLGIRRMRERQAREDGVGHFRQRCRDPIDSGIRDIAGLGLSHDKGEVEL